ncbi:radical SAM family heme chaperone HemW [Persephonella sp.]
MIKGLYIHIPFCELKCPYCDFVSIENTSKDLVKKYFEYLKKELLLYKDENYYLKTIYFGGGTPSVADPKSIVDLIKFVKENFKTETSLEITVEINPKTYRLEDFMSLKEGGVNRISLGIQSFIDKNLINLGRNHNSKDGIKAVEDCYNSGIKNINLDMIYGIKDQTLNDLEEDLKIYTSLPIKHISAYMLTAYDGTELSKQVKGGDYKLPDEDKLFKMFVMIDDYLKDKGFERYELSNWCKEGFKCKHNYFYWTHIEYLGIGVSAWSFINKVRSGNTISLDEYFSTLDRDLKPIKFQEVIDDKEFLKEKIFLNLRLSDGIDIEYLKGKEGLIKDLVKEGYGFEKNGKFVLTKKGLIVINNIVSILTN